MSQIIYSTQTAITGGILLCSCNVSASHVIEVRVPDKNSSKSLNIWMVHPNLNGKLKYQLSGWPSDETRPSSPGLKSQACLQNDVNTLKSNGMDTPGVMPKCLIQMLMDCRVSRLTIHVGSSVSSSVKPCPAEPSSPINL